MVFRANVMHRMCFMPILQSVIRKLLTKPIWWWERNRPYPLLTKIERLAPEASDPRSVWRLVVLTTTGTFRESLWAAYSAVQLISPRPEIVFYVDGEIPENGADMLAGLFPCSRVESSRGVLRGVPSECPFLTDACLRNSSARKMAIQAVENREKAVLYMDADILFFKKPEEIITSIQTGEGVWHVDAHEGLRADEKLMGEVRRRGIPYLENYNSGLLFLSKGSLTCEMIEPWISPDLCNPDAWFIDQTILAILLPKLQSKLLPMDRYVVSCRRQFYFEEDHPEREMVMRHYMGPVRHLMHSKGIPRLWKRWGKS